METRGCSLGRDRVYTGLGGVVGGPAGRPQGGGKEPAWLQPSSRGLWPSRNQKLAARVPSREWVPEPPPHPGRAAGIWEHPGCGQTSREGDLAAPRARNPLIR